MSKPIPEKFKQEIINKIRTEGLSVLAASRQYNTSTKNIYRWLESGITPNTVSILTHNKLKAQIAELYEIIGRLTMEKKKSEKKRHS